MKDTRNSLKMILPMLVGLVSITMACGEPTENDEPGPGGTNQTNGGETPDVPTIDDVTISKVADLNPGSDARPESFTIVGDTLYFVGHEAPRSRVWATDGTEAGTVSAFDPDDSSEIRDLVAFDGALYFAHANRTLYSTTGTEASVEEIDEVGAMSLRILGVVGDQLIYTGGWANGRQLRATDGTDGRSVQEINPDSDAIEASPHNNLAVMGGHMYFRANDGTTGWQLWRTDGTESGTTRITDLDGHEGAGWVPAGLRTVELDGGGEVILLAADDGEQGSQLWMTDGTESGTEMVATINPTGNASPSNFAGLNGAVVFSATTTGSSLDRTLWVTDGTAEGTEEIHGVALHEPFVEFNGYLYFGGEHTEQQNQVGLWRTDGTASGTEEIAPDVTPRNFTEYGGLLFFAGDDGNSNRQLFVSDGTSQGTRVLRPEDSAEDALDTGYGASELIVFGDRLFFSADYDGEGHQLWSLEL